jgi:hypothetical protein
VPLPVVTRLVPFQLTVEVDTKPLPFTVTVKLLLPAVAFCGVMEEILGAVAETGAGLPPPVDPELPELPEEQFTNEIRTAAVITIRHNREVMWWAIEACTEGF